MLIQEAKLVNGLWIAADKAHICDEQIITLIPTENAPSDSPADGFNFAPSSHRMHIEQSFGMLMARWGTIWKPLQFALRLNFRTIKLAMLLHNFCADCRDNNFDDLVTDDEYDAVRIFVERYTQEEFTRRR